MNAAVERLRKYMLSAKLPERWETAPEIASALRANYGLFCTAKDVREWLRELSMDRAVRLTVRTREDSGMKEYWLSDKPEVPAEGKK